MHNNWEDESGLALKAVTDASEVLVTKSKCVNFTQKHASRELVTDFDIEIENMIIQKLSPTLYPIVAEEENFNSKNLENDTFWVIDPIDGTVNFIYDIPLFAISVGLCHRDKFVVGAVSIPGLQEIYFTHGDQASYLNGRLLTVSRENEICESLFVASFSGTRDSNTRDIDYQLFGQINDISRGCLRLGSAATAICFVASGRIDCAYGLNVKIWDIAGSMAVAERAGYQTYLDRLPGSENVDFVVGSGCVVTEVMKMINGIKCRHKN